MGSLLRDQGGWIILDKLSPPSPLIPFHQRQNNRSPLESPPVAKKLPRVKDTNLFFGQMFVELPSNSPSPVYLDLADGGGKENRSILKKCGPKNRVVRCGRRVDFDQDVVVYHFDRVEGGHVSSERERLNSDQKDRKEFINRSVHGGNTRPATTSNTTSDTYSTKISLFGRREPPIQYAVPVTSQYADPHHHPVTSHYAEPPILTSQYDGPRHVIDQTPVYYASTMMSRRVPDHHSPSTTDSGLPTGSSESQDEVDFSFFEDDQHGLRLKFSIHLGDGVAASDVLVKANTTGNKVRVVGTRTVGTSRHHGTLIRQEFTERYQLPMEVDPYMITARMDNSGNLYVEAPVLTVDRKRALAVERHTLDGSPISSDFVL